MAEPICEDEGLLQEWSPLTNLLQKIPLKVQKGLFSQNLNLTCIDVISEYIALGTNSHIVYWYSRINGELQKFQLENSHCEITCVKVVSTVDYMIAAGTNQGTIVVFQIPKILPNSIPDHFKQKKRQIERFTINDLHKSPITYIEWSQNGMKLFSGDKKGLVALTEMDFYMHLSKSVELLNEQFEIVQLSYSQQLLIVSTTCRSVVCDGANNWKVHQIGTKERKILGKFGAALCKFDHDFVSYACRPGYRLWLADKSGVVQQTLIFKSAVHSNCPKIQVINPINKNLFDMNFGKILQFGDKLITYNSDVLYLLHPGAVSVTAVLNNVRKILDLAVNENEIFILEGSRSLLRISAFPDKYALDINEHIKCRRSAFSLDGFAAKIKDTTMGSIKKLTMDFMAMPEQTSPSSFRPSANDALDLPPIVYLPNGSVPSIFCDQIKIETPQDNINWFEVPLSHKLLNGQTENEFGNKNSNFPFNQDQEEIISRPLRKKHYKLSKKNLSASQVLEWESDTTSNTSDDRFTWGFANDLSPSDDSNISRSNSSFSVLRDISTATDRGIALKDKEFGSKGNTAQSDCKSQISLDTCESVSECLMSNSENFRQEQEKTFARIANQSAMIGNNGDKTNMSISTNTMNSGSVESEKIYSSGEDIENPASQIEDNDRKISPINSIRQLEETNEKKLVEKLAETNILPRYKLAISDCRNSESSDDDDAANSNNETECAQSETTDGIETIKNISRDAKKNCNLDFRMKKLFEYYSREKSSQKNNDKMQICTTPNKNIKTCEDGKLSESKSETTSEFSLKSSLSYHQMPQNESYPAIFKPNITGNGNVSITPGNSNGECAIKISHHSEHWPEHEAPEPITSLALSKHYALCVDVNDRVYYSKMSGPGLSWVLLDFSASDVRVSQDGSIIWLINNKSVFSLINSPSKYPAMGNGSEITSSVLSFTIDCKNNDGWVVTSLGRIVHYQHQEGGTFKKPEEVWCPYLVTDIASSDGLIVVLTVQKQLLCKTLEDGQFRIIKTTKFTTSSFTLAPNNILWVLDDKNLIYFSDDFSSENPSWWQIQISDYIFKDSNATLQNIYNKMKLNKLTGNGTVKEKTFLIAANEDSVWICEKYSTSIRINKLNFAGYMWNQVLFQKSLTTLYWITLTSEGVFENKGHVWLLATNGHIFCTSPANNKFQTIPVPCEDDVFCIASSSDTLWVLSGNGSIYSRLGLGDNNLTGNSWRELKLPQIDNLKLIWVSCGCDVAWGCDVHGRTFMTIGSPHHMATNIFDAAWLEVEGKPKGVKFVKVFVGPQMYMVWAIDNKNKVYVREGIFSYYQIGTGWVLVEGIEAVHVSISSTSVWALSPNGTVYRRCGISECNYIGDYWQIIPGTFKVISSSFTDDLWGITHENEIMKLSYRVKTRDDTNLGEGEKKNLTNEGAGWEIVN